MGNITFNYFKDFSEFATISNEKWYNQVIKGEKNSYFESWYPYELLDVSINNPLHK